MRLAAGFLLACSACTLVELDDLDRGTTSSSGAGAATTTSSSVAATSGVTASASSSSAGSGAGGGGSLGPYGNAVIASAPLAYYRFEDDPGGLAVHDEMGMHDAAYAGSPGRRVDGGIVGEPSSAISFDGQSSVRMPDGFEFVGTSPFSIEVWFRVPQVTQLQFLLGNESGNFPTRQGYTIVAYDDGNVGIERWGFDDAAANVAAGATLGPGTLAIDTWYHLAVTFDGTVHNAYLNGVVGTHFGPVFALVDDGLPLIVGASGDLTAHYVGQLDELALYDRALSPAEVATHWAAAQ